MTETVPTDAQVVLYAVTDGDTVRVFRRWRIQLNTCDAGPGLLMDEIRELYDDPGTHPRGVAGRLVHLDTPESRTDKAGWQKAKDDLNSWCEQHRGRLRAVFTEHGGFDRILLDLYVEGDRSNTASQWMLMHGNDGHGWPPYVKGS